MLKFVPDHFKTQKMRDKAVKKDRPYFLQFVLDWFVTQEQIKIWDDARDSCICDMMMMVIIGMMMTNFLGGTKAIKNGKLKKPQQSKNSYLLLGIHQGGGIGV